MCIFTLILLAACGAARGGDHAEDVFLLLLAGPQLGPFKQDGPSRDELLANLEKVAKYDLDSIEGGMILLLERSRDLDIKVDDAELQFMILNSVVFDVPSDEVGPLRVDHGKPILGPLGLKMSGPPRTAITDFRRWRRLYRRRKGW